MKYIIPLLILATVIMTGCTSVNVRPVPSGHTIKSVSIIENPKVKISDFTDVLIDGFARHGISASVVKTEAEAIDEYTVFYVAYRQWDMAPYLCDATIRIEQNGRTIATAEFHLKAGGGLTFSKYRGTKSKINPVIDKLLKNL